MDLPSSVRHTQLRLSRVLCREIQPQWDEERSSWTFTVHDTISCGPELLAILNRKSCDTKEHSVAVRIIYANARRTYGMQSWALVKSTIQLDDLEPESIPVGVIESLFAQRQNTDSDGKLSSGTHQTSRNTNLDVRKNTVIRT